VSYARFLAFVLTCALLPSCQPDAGRRERLRSPNPYDRAAAAIDSGEVRDRDAIHKLVDLLDDTDPAVRMYSILSLKRLCGQDYGYHYYDNDTLRTAAVERWRDALRAGAVTARTEPSRGDSGPPSAAEGERGSP
jgi:hypothetical protein